MSEEQDREPAVVRRRVGVTGRVQGVTFRAATRVQAERLGVVGWVRNRADGSVEAELEGPADLVATLVGWMREGPPLARVDTVVVTEVEANGETRFEVR